MAALGLTMSALSAFGDPFLVSNPVPVKAPMSPTSYAVYGLPAGSPLYFSLVAARPGFVQLYVDLGPGINLSSGSYGVFAAASNSQGTSLGSSIFSFTLPLRSPPSGPPPPKGSPQTPMLFLVP